MRSTLLLLAFIILPISAAGQNPIGDTIDCTDIRVDYSDDPNLTREERLILMDEALMESINKFEHCQKQKALNGGTDASNNESAGSSVQGAERNGNIKQGVSGETDDGGGAFSGGVESAASSSMSGTEPAPFETNTPGTTENFQTEESAGTPKPSGGKNHGNDGEPRSKGGIKARSNVDMKNGQTPDDIPNAKNDDALAAQIRYAAENETDPEKREQLWNEYRKYKGLPQK